MRWVLGGRSDGIAETTRCRNCVEAESNLKREHQPVVILKGRQTAVICRELRKVLTGQAS